MKKYSAFVRKTAGLLLATGILAINYSPAFCEFRALPDTISIVEGQDLELRMQAPFEVSTDETAFVALNTGETLRDVAATEEPINIEVSLFGVIPLKNIEVYVHEESWVIPGGHTIGVSLYTQGALVVGISDVIDQAGESICPAAAAGIQPGDYIESFDGIPIENAEQLMAASVDGLPAEVTLNRDGKQIKTTIQPVVDSRDGEYRLGIWVRDSTMGIGTLSFCDSSLGWYGGLGHAIIDVDTNTMLNVREGKIVEADVIDIITGQEGQPGEIRGTFHSGSTVYGDIQKNTVFGIYGSMQTPLTNELYPAGIKLAYPEEAHEGEAQILAALGSSSIQAFDCEIVKVNPQNSPAPKGLVIQVTDHRLLEETGGIVQGMSGSPLVQDGKLLGVVTHVFVNDPTKGYCMYALWMKEQMN